MACGSPKYVIALPTVCLQLIVQPPSHAKSKQKHGHTKLRLIGVPCVLAVAPIFFISEISLRYQKEVSVKKRGYQYEANLFDRILMLPLADVRLPNLSEMHFRQWADQRLKEVKSSSVRREWNVLSNVLTYASTEWRLIPENFMLRLEKPAGAPARTQRISNQVAKQIAYAASYSLMCTSDTATQRAAAAFYFALETAMRAGEICSLSWDNDWG